MGTTWDRDKWPDVFFPSHVVLVNLCCRVLFKRHDIYSMSPFRWFSMKIRLHLAHMFIFVISCLSGVGLCLYPINHTVFCFVLTLLQNLRFVVCNWNIILLVLIQLVYLMQLKSFKLQLNHALGPNDSMSEAFILSYMLARQPLEVTQPVRLLLQASPKHQHIPAVLMVHFSFSMTGEQG